jgi:elongation factor P
MREVGDERGGVEHGGLADARRRHRGPRGRIARFSHHTRQLAMAKVLATEIRVGNLLEWDKRVWRVLKSYHVHVGGRGGAFMQVEMKDIEAGTKTNTRFRTDEKVERAYVEPREMQYLYQEGANYVFMDKDTYEQLPLSAEMLEGQTEFLLPNTDVQINFHNERPIGVQLPPSVVLTVVETDPNIKGATATTSFKPAKTETGLVVQVPPFIETGEKIKVNTDDGGYIERA